MAVDFVPKVTRRDVLRVVERDFPLDEREAALTILDQYGAEEYDREPHRVHLAILKMSVGELERLGKYLKIAKGDYRDILALAEYPRFLEVGFTGVEEMTPKEVRQLKKDDWEQYRRWLEGE